jgi:hypothetical protein
MLATLRWGSAPPTLVKALDEIDSDRTVQDARSAIDKAAEAPTLLDTACLDYAAFVNFVAFRQYAQLVKARRGALTEDTEALVVARGRDAVESYRRLVTTLTQFVSMLRELRVLDSFDTHMSSLFVQPAVNPMFQIVKDEFRNMGVPDDLAGAVVADIEMHRGNPCKILGADGTIDGLMAKVNDRIARLDESQKITEEHGLPVIEGACSSGNEVGAAAAGSGIVIGIGIVACAILCFL